MDDFFLKHGKWSFMVLYLYDWKKFNLLIHAMLNMIICIYILLNQNFIFFFERAKFIIRFLYFAVQTLTNIHIYPSLKKNGVRFFYVSFPTLYL